MKINFGTLMEIVEDWIRNNLDHNRIFARFVDGEDVVEAVIDGAYFVEDHGTVCLLVRRTGQDDLFDDKGILLNDESPRGIYGDLKDLEENEVDYTTPIEIEIWFSEGEDDIQYRLECHQYFVSKTKLAVIHFLGREDIDFEDEFKSLLHEQY